MKGFTLIELIIYVAIATTILSLLIGFLWNIVFGNIKITANLEVQQNARFAMIKISQEIKKAVGVNSPQPDSPPAAFLSLIMADPNLNPTVFDIIDGKLRITQGSYQPQELTSDQVIVSDLKFSNLSYPDTPATLQVQLSVNYLNPENRIEYQASVEIDSTVSLLPGGASP